jgi:hypothetical protein
MALRTGERFPEMAVQTVDGGRMTIPQDVEGAYKAILFYRGGW